MSQFGRGTIESSLKRRKVANDVTVGFRFPKNYAVFSGTVTLVVRQLLLLLFGQGVTLIAYEVIERSYETSTTEHEFSFIEDFSTRVGGGRYGGRIWPDVSRAPEVFIFVEDVESVERKRRLQQHELGGENPMIYRSRTISTVQTSTCRDHAPCTCLFSQRSGFFIEFAADQQCRCSYRLFNAPCRFYQSD